MFYLSIVKAAAYIQMAHSIRKYVKSTVLVPSIETTAKHFLAKVSPGFLSNRDYCVFLGNRPKDGFSSSGSLYFASMLFPLLETANS